MHLSDFPDLVRRIGDAIGAHPEIIRVSFGCEDRWFPRVATRHWIKIERAGETERELTGDEIEAVERAGFVRVEATWQTAGWEIEMKQEANMGKRRPIARADEGEVRRRVKVAIEDDDAPRLHFNVRGILATIEASDDMSLTGAEIAALASVGIFPGPDGWEIEDAPAVAVRRALPAPWQWWKGCADTEYLARANNAEMAIATAEHTRAEVYQSEDSAVFESFRASSLAEARERAEDECWERGLFGVSDAPPVASTPVDREQATEEPAFPADAGVPRDPLPLSEPSADPAARAWLRMFSVATGIGIDGTREGHPDTTPTQRIQQVARLCDSFVAELRAARDVEIARLASVAGPDRHSLVDYLSEHHADTWHANETAAAFAVRLLKSADDTIETLRREAEGADAARAVVATERDTFREEARRLREQVGALDRELASAREGARGLGVTCQAAQEARDVYQRRADVAEGKLVYARGGIEAMTDQVVRLKQLLSPKVES